VHHQVKKKLQQHLEASVRSIEAGGDTWTLTAKNGGWYDVHLLVAGKKVPSLFTGIDEEACLQFIWSRYNNIPSLKKEDLKEVE